jgi:hypothetical protein
MENLPRVPTRFNDNRSPSPQLNYANTAAPGAPGNPNSDSSSSDDNRSPSPPPRPAPHRSRRPHATREPHRPSRDDSEPLEDRYTTPPVAPPLPARDWPGRGHSQPLSTHSIHQYRFNNETSVLRDRFRRLIEDFYNETPPQLFGLDGTANGIATPAMLAKMGLKPPAIEKYAGSSDLEAFETWLVGLLRLFRLYGLFGRVHDRLHVQLAGGYLDKAASKFWIYQSETPNAPHRGWTFIDAIAALADRFLQQFSSEKAARKLANHRQNNDSVDEYYIKMETLMRRMAEPPSRLDANYHFLDGLNAEIAGAILGDNLTPEFNSLTELYNAAKAKERALDRINHSSSRRSRDNPRSSEHFSSSRPSSHKTNTSSSNSRPRDRDSRNRTYDNAQASKQPTTNTNTTRNSNNYNNPNQGYTHNTGQAGPSHTYQSRNDTRPSTSSGALPSDTCRNCGMRGHWAKDCRKRKVSARVAIVENENEHSGSESAGEDQPDPRTAEPSIKDEDSDSQSDNNIFDQENSTDDENSGSVYGRSAIIYPLNLTEEAFAAKIEPIYSNQVKHKQPRRILAKQQSVVCWLTINGHLARCLVDSGSTTEMMSPQFAAVYQLPIFALTEPMGLQLAVSGSRSTISNGINANIRFDSTTENRYFDIVNSDRFDIVLGTPFLHDHNLLIDVREGVLRRRDMSIVDTTYETARRNSNDPSSTKATIGSSK